MKEIARKEYGYIFYEIDNKYLLSTLCGTVGLFTVDFFLNQNETKKYEEQGIEFINKLAGDVTRFYDNYWNRCIITYLDYFVFGIFKSESYDSYSIYKIDKENLKVDNSESWHNDRFKENGYSFQGNKLDIKLFNKHKHLIYSIPQEIYKSRLKTHNSTDNKVENKLIIEFKCYDTINKFTIDLYDNSNEQNLTQSMKDFVNRMLNEINEIKNGC
jgi:hypothetical protein